MFIILNFVAKPAISTWCIYLKTVMNCNVKLSIIIYITFTYFVCIFINPTTKKSTTLRQCVVFCEAAKWAAPQRDKTRAKAWLHFFSHFFVVRKYKMFLSFDNVHLLNNWYACIWIAITRSIKGAIIQEGISHYNQGLFIVLAWHNLTFRRTGASTLEVDKAVTAWLTL